ncbi:MAG: RDD family protein [Pirellulales bacterium]
MPSAKRQLDGRIEVVTPENVTFKYRVAGPFQRLPAYAIDLAIRVAVGMSVGFAAIVGLNLIGLGGIGMTIMLVAWFLLAWFYGGLFETFWNGQTPGKRAMRLRVLSVDGKPISAMQAVLRNVLRVVDGLPPMAPLLPSYLLGLSAGLTTERFQRLGDLACGTMVVVEQRVQLRGVMRMHSPQVQALAAALPADLSISRNLGQALGKYVLRRESFPPPRRSEIARHVGAPLVERLRLPPETDHDLLLCALYHRKFVTDQLESSSPPPTLPSGGLVATVSPMAAPPLG